MSGWLNPIPNASKARPRAAGSSEPACSAPYGFCPICGANGVMRERRPDGNDRCSAGHTYPSRNSVGEVRPDPPAKCPTCGRPNNGLT